MSGVGNILEGIAGVSWPWLVLAMALHALSQVVRQPAWANLINRAQGDGVVRVRDAVWASQLAAPLGLFSPVPRTGSGLRPLLLARITRARASVTFATLIPEALPEAVLTAITVAVVLLGGTVRLQWPELQLLSLLIGMTGAGLLLAAAWLLRRRLRPLWVDVRAAVRLVEDWRWFLGNVASWQLISRCVRLLSVLCFLQAWSMPHGLYSALLVMGIWGLAGFLPGPAGWPARVAALSLAWSQLGFAVPPAQVAGFVMGLAAACWLLTVILGLLTLVWALVANERVLLRSVAGLLRRRRPAVPAPESP